MIGVIVNGTTYSFDNATYGYVTATDGFGMPPIDRYSERGAQQHGDRDLGYRLAERRVTLVIQVPAETETEFYTARQRILALFHPSNAITIIATNGAMDRRIDVVFDYSTTLPMDEEWKVQNIAVVCKTSGLPVWYDPSARSAQFDLGGGAGSFAVPLTIPHAVGSSEIDASAVLSYSGTWEEYPQIRITGPLNDCVITNNETGETLDFTGYSLPASHYIQIDTRYGIKTVLYDGLTNYIDKLTAESDLATFHIAPTEAGETAHENSFTVTGDSANTASKIEIYWNDRYIGI